MFQSKKDKSNGGWINENLPKPETNREEIKENKKH